MMRRLAVFLAALGLLGTGTAAATATSAPPGAWPNNSSVQPQLDVWPNALRVFGTNRYQTALAATLVLRGGGSDNSYPYGSPDAASAAGWWGLDTCPRSIIIVAGDSPADALAASSLSDPTGQSTEPYLQRSGAADPVFYPPGGFARVDTDFAPILATTSARQNATQLDIATRLAAQELSRGSCTTAKQAIIVGGVRAVPATVEAELVSIGYDEVFRIAGSSRYQTARLVAESLGTADAPGTPPRTSCADGSSANGARSEFYANSVVEYRESDHECRLLGRTVVLADGESGIDALAAGWWTSFWQVPILLADGDDILPLPTRSALQTIDIDTLVVLGGTARISESVVDDALELSGATEAIRVSGDDRYETSLLMAQHFGGWFATGDGSDAEASLLCVAASSGGSGTVPGVGWPDALTIGPWCARMGVARAALGAPDRALSPVAGGSGAIVSTSMLRRPPRHAMAPVVLVPAGGTDLPSELSSGLRGMFPTRDTWCSGEELDADCLAPGFAVVFGGSTLVTDAQLATIDRLVSGGVADSDDRSASSDEPWWTQLDMAPVFADPFPTSVHGEEQRVCHSRGGDRNARWLVIDSAGLSTYDLVENLAYGRDSDGVRRTPGVGRPQCVAFDGETGRVWVASATGSSPLPEEVSVINASFDEVFTLSGDLNHDVPSSSSGTNSSVDDSNGDTTTWTFAGDPGSVTAVSRGDSATVTSSNLDISLVRGRDGVAVAPHTFTAEFTVTADAGTIRGRVVGEALFSVGVWHLRGAVTYRTGSWTVDRGMGGFAADIDVESVDTNDDDSIVWRIDGAVT